MKEILHQFKRMRHLLPLLAGMMLLSMAVNGQTGNYAPGSEPRVTTDKDDYAPGEIAIMTGSGWTEDTRVDIYLEETPYQGHDEFFSVSINPDGTWLYEFPINEKHLGVEFHLFATGNMTGYVAETIFTDGNVNMNATGIPGGSLVNYQYTTPPPSNTLNSTSGTTNFSFGARNNTIVRFSYEKVKEISSIKYVLLTVGINSGTLSSGTSGYDHQFESPGQPRTITGDYGVLKSDNVTATYANSVILASTFYSNYQTTTGIAGKTITFYIDGTAVGTGVTNASGVATLNLNLGNIPTLGKLDADSYDITTSFAGDSGLLAVPEANSTGSVLTINQRAITITADVKSRTYGDSDPALTAQVTSGTVVSGDIADGDLKRVAGENVGAYAINKNTYTYGSNYDETYVPADLTIGTRAITITADAKSKTYGDTDPDLTAQVTSGTVVSGDIAGGDLERVAGENVGAYAINKNTYTYGSNYNETYVPADLTIGQRAITITADVKSKTYGDADPDLTAQLTSGTVVGSDAASGNLERVSGENVGAYAINMNTYTYGSNYDETYVPADLTIGQRAITITADEKSKTYGDSDPALTAQVTSGTVVSGDIAAGNLERVSGENVGAYAINKNTYTYGSNYDETYVSADLTIGQRAITITADEKSKTYGDADPALTAQVTSGTVVSGDIAGGDLERVSGENVGAYAINKNTYTYGSNYDETYVPADLTIGQRAITITADDKSKTYGDSDPALTAQVTSGTVVGSDAASGDLERVAGENVGAYAINKNTYTYGSNYDETYVPADLTIGQRAITITADAKSKTYGDADPDLTAQVTSGTVVSGDAASGDLERVAGENVGAYAINMNTYTYGTNYDETYVPADLTIGQRAITITADAKSKTYGDADPDLTAQVTSGTVVSGDAASGDLERAAGENVGAYAISKNTYTYGSNYDETYVPADLTIGQRAITITADAKSKTYGDADPALTAQVTSGTVVGSDAASGDLERVAGENVGAYAINKNTYTYGFNYDETYVPADLTIGQRAITITADAKSKTYGDADPALTAQVTSGTVVGSDAASGDLERVAGENVGAYAINMNTYTYGSNYDETYVPADLTIGQRAITITADEKSKTYGDSDPALTAQVTSGTVVSGDIAAGNLERVSGENVGAYAINKNTYTYGSNYDETYVPADLTIGQRAITITADAKSKTYGDADPGLTAQVTSGTIVGSDAASGDLERAAGENVGAYAISKNTYTYGSNYDETYVPADLTIGQRAITITADAKSKTYGDADPALTAQVTSGTVVGSDAASGDLERVAGENVGAYAINKNTYTYGTNYDETYVSADLTIGQRAITITADAKSKTYGDADPDLTAQVTSGTVVSGDAASGDLERAAGENVGAYAISKNTYTYGSNYDETYGSADLTIGQRAITITADAKSKTYGDSDPALTAQVTSGTIVSGDAASGDLERAVGENVGTYAINKNTYTYGSNYNETYVPADLTIGTRAITITADVKSKTYGDPDPDLTAQVTSGTIVASDAASGDLGRVAGENVGAYAISKNTYTYGSNYDETYVSADLTIGQRAITITADEKSKTYGDADPALTAQVTSGTVVSGDIAGGDLERVSGENVGAYAINKNTYTYGSNYDETYVPADLTIGQRAITITADAKSKTYGDADPDLTAQVTSGTVVGSDAASGDLERVAGENVGAYAINKNTYTYGTNYDETYVPADLTIGQRAITITADAKSKTYGDADPALTAQVTSGTVVGSDAASGDLERVAGENVGAYAINKNTYTYGSNYDETYVPADLTIGQRAITITADAKSKTYGDADPALTAQVTSGTVVSGDIAGGDLERVAGENVGAYAINKNTYTYGTNYDETYVSADLTIGTRAITITADAKSKTYGDADPGLTAQVTSGTIVGSDAASGDLERVTGENVGAYAINKNTYTYGSNYNETYVSADLTIGQRAITITADDKSKTYGDSDPALTAQVTSGTVVGSDAASGDLERVAGENVGAYAINKNTYTYGTNYDETYVPADLTIGQRAITITADAKSKTYGDADPDLTAQVTSGTIVGSDAASGDLERVAGENVGAYAINKNTYTYGTNYDETYVPADLTIGQRAITITADAKSKTYGDADPALTAQVTSGTVVGSDAASGDLERVAGENVGAYAINKNTYTYGSNYDETYVPADLTIGQRAITITADAKSKTYGDADPALTAQVTSGTVVSGDIAGGDLERVAGENVGAYAINKNTYTYGSNYDETYVPADLTIGQRAITITADEKSKTYGDADPDLTAQVTSGTVVSGDAASGDLERVAGENVGAYAINKNTYTYGTNYDETYVPADLTIGQRAITITADAKSKTYGDADPDLTAQVTSGTVVSGDIAGGDLERVAGENVGAYAINKNTYTYGTNYDETYVSADLTIGTRAITITADAKSKTYGDADPDLTAQVTSGTVVSGDAASGDLERVAGENVGAYAINKNTYTYGSNYDETYVSADLTIGQRAITITADEKSKTYGDADPDLTAQVTSGTVVSGDAASGDLERVAGENVGAYAINKNTYTYGTNYDETYVPADLTIGQRAITITADAKSKTYGDADPDLTAQVTSGTVVSGDIAGGDLERVAGENVGAYAINKNTYTYGSNYDETYVPADLTIVTRAITIKADDKSKFCGQVNPELTYKITSGTLVNEDGFTGSLTTSNEGAGNHPINQGTLTLGDNYALTFVSGSITITGIFVDATGSYVNIQISNTGQLSATVSPVAAGIPVTFTIYEEDNSTVRVVLNGTTDATGVATVNWTAPSTIGVYKVVVMAGSSECDASMEAYISVFDPSSSFVTGGGWFNSPVGAMPAKPEVVGKANFGFVSKYKKGKNNTNTEEVDGNTEFQFQSGDLNFKSTLHESGSLIVAGRRATYRGSGTINGQSGFKFMVVGIDGDWNGQKNPDRFRIKITTNSGVVVYDNQIGSDDNSEDATILGNNGTGGGSIVIHEVKAKGSSKRIDTGIIEVEWNTPFATIEKDLVKMSKDWFDGNEILIKWDNQTYEQMESGFYQVNGFVQNNPWFEMEEAIAVQVLVLDKPLATDIIIDSNVISAKAIAGQVIGSLNTIDASDNLHTYSIDENPNLYIDGNKLIWKGNKAADNLVTVTLRSTDRVGQTIEKAVTLYREMLPNEIVVYPNPTYADFNIQVQMYEGSEVIVSIFDTTGRLVYQEEAYQENSFVRNLELKSLSNGVYHIVVKVGHQVMTKRLIKK